MFIFRLEIRVRLNIFFYLRPSPQPQPQRSSLSRTVRSPIRSRIPAVARLGSTGDPEGGERSHAERRAKLWRQVCIRTGARCTHPSMHPTGRSLRCARQHPIALLHSEAHRSTARRRVSRSESGLAHARRRHACGRRPGSTCACGGERLHGQRSSRRGVQIACGSQMLDSISLPSGIDCGGRASARVLRRRGQRVSVLESRHPRCLDVRSRRVFVRLSAVSGCDGHLGG